MGLFDSIAGNLMNSMLGGQSGGLGKLAADVMSGNHHELSASVTTLLTDVGGVQGLMQKAQEAGLGNVVNSWVGTGANQPISSDQLTQLLGSDVVKHVAEKFGVDASQAAPLMATVLPGIIDKLTPKGEADADGHSQDSVHAAIAALTQGGGITSLLSGFMSATKQA